MNTDEPIQDWKHWYNQALTERVQRMELKRANRRLRDALAEIAKAEIPPHGSSDSWAINIARQALESADDEH